MVHSYRRLVIGLLLALLLLMLLPGSVLAEDPTVTITITAWVFGYPGGFTVTYVNDNYVDLTWTNPPDSVNTTVRAAFGHVPEDITDGYQVYLGVGENCSDTALTLASPEIVYYRAWTETEEGWGELFASADTGELMSASFLFIGLIVLALGVTGLSFARRSIVLSMGAAVGWLVLGTLLVTTPTILGPYDLTDGWVQVLVFLPFMMSVGCLLWFVSGIGKTKVTMTDTTGRTWGMWERPPVEKVSSRSQQVREKHKSRLRSIRGRTRR